MLRGRVLPHAGLEALIGRMNFAQSTTCKRFANGMINPLYWILYARPYDAAISPLVRRTLYWRYSILSSLPPRRVDEPKIRPGYVLYTDASYEEGPLASGLCAILFLGAESMPGWTNSSGMPLLPAVALFTRTATPADVDHFRETSVTYGLELFTVVAALFSPRYRLRGCAVTI